MYTPKHFAIDDSEESVSIIERRGLGTLVVMTPSGLDASPLPWLVRRADDGALVLAGHLARANPLARSIVDEQPALVVFDLTDGYVSPSWYPTKHETREVVPTWNYVSVHAHGRVRLVNDAQWLHHLVTELTDRHERRFERPWAVTDAPDGYVARMLRAIVGVEVGVDRLEGKAKLSQNRGRADFDGVVEALTGSAPTLPLAQEMRRRRPGP